MNFTLSNSNFKEGENLNYQGHKVTVQSSHGKYITVVDENGKSFSLPKDSPLLTFSSWGDRIIASNNKLIDKISARVEENVEKEEAALSNTSENLTLMDKLKRAIRGNKFKNDDEKAELVAQMQDAETNYWASRRLATACNNRIFSDNLSIFCLTCDNAKYANMPMG